MRARRSRPPAPGRPRPPAAAGANPSGAVIVHVDARRWRRRASASAPCCSNHRLSRRVFSPCELTLTLLQRLKVGQHLARMELVGKRVDDRDVAPAAIASSRSCAERPPNQRRRRTAKGHDPCLPASPHDRAGWSGRRRPSRDRPAAQFPSRTRTVYASILFEDQLTPRGPSSGRPRKEPSSALRRVPRTSACCAGVRSSSRRKCLTGRHCFPGCGHCALSRIAGSAATNSRPAPVRTSGGASRTNAGCAGFIR